jgi:hypothetical protein
VIARICDGTSATNAQPSTSSSRCTALAGDRLGAAARPPDRDPRERPGRAVLGGGAEGDRSSSSSPTRSTCRCCSCTTRPATWSARSTSRAASSSTAR